MQIYAHRAARGLAPENTLFACHEALQHDIDFIDFDIGMTKDEKLVVTHDVALNPDITRDTQGRYITESILVSELLYEELEIFNVGRINPSSLYATYFPAQKSVAFAKIPLLSEAIEYVLSMRDDIAFQLEIKVKPGRTASAETFASALYQLLKESNLIDRTEVQSFDYRALLALQKLDAAIKTTCLTLPGILYAPLNYFKKLNASCWSPFQMDVTKPLVEEAKNLGLKIVPWGYPEKEGTEFNAAQIAKLLEWQVDGIITDRPDILKNNF
jgi:glycerophosphoryl diester phosphodiesterase